MLSNRSVQLILYFLAAVAWWPVGVLAQPLPESRQVNLAIRRTADKLLRISGDSTSKIGAVEKINPLTWRLQLDKEFIYDSLPKLLQSSFAFYHITNAYDVTIRQCETNIIDLGYHQKDFILDSLVPCGGRELPDGCHYIEVVFEGEINKSLDWTSRSILLLLGLTSSAGLWWLLRRKPEAETKSTSQDGTWIHFGKSRLHFQRQVLEIEAVQQSLTYREAKLLNLFVTHPGELLERDHIHQLVWADEGLQVTRSVDVFVSRLRKKLAADKTITISAVHGVGYKLEVNANSGN